jgi:hypothetical protein
MEERIVRMPYIGGLGYSARKAPGSMKTAWRG